MNHKSIHTCFKMAILTLLLTALASGIGAGELEKNPLYRAMTDELARSVKRLRLEKLERPFYVEYTVRDYEWISIDASFGALLKSDRDRKRFLSVDLRVGDHSFDNTNYVGSSLRDIEPQVVSLVTENNYHALRHQLWLATDEAYKKALETVSKKRAYVKSRTIKERPDDLSREKPFIYEEPEAQLTVRLADWERRIQKLSGIFKKHPGINESKLEFRVTTCNQYFLNSEGSKYRRADQLFSLEVTASTQAKDGMRLSDFATFYSKSLDDFPKNSQIAARIEGLAESLINLAKAEPIESYVGPVLFQGQASAEFFNQLLGKNVSNPRSPLFEEERISALFEGSKLAGKLNRRILPGFISGVDDPTRKRSNGTPLIGWYPVDDDGMPAQSVRVVEKGKLVSLLMSRIPTKKISKSNGHGRGTLYSPVVGNPGNLIISSEEEVDFEELKEELISTCKDMDLEYGILIRRMGSEAFEEEAPSWGVFGKPKPQLTRPIQVYKVWVKDGREELLRGGEFAGVTLRVMKDIAGTSTDHWVYNFIKKDLFGRSGIPTSVVAPSILVEELELNRASEELPKPPILPHPYFDLKF